MKTKELKKYSVQVLMMTVTYMISMLLPILFSYLIDDILIMGKGDELWGWFGITFLVAILSMVCKFLFCQYLPVKIGIRNTFKLQIKSAENIMGMNQSIYAKKDKGYYYNLCSNSCGSYGDLHEEIHLKLVSELLYIFGILAVITYVNRFFGVFFAVYGMILVLISLYSARPLYGLQKDSMSVQDKYLGGIRNIIENKGGINAIHTESFFKKKFVACVDEYEKFILKFRFWNYLCAYLPDIVNQIFNVAYLFVAALLVFRGDITTGILLMGYQYLGYFSSPISTVCSILMRYKANKIHIERVDKLTETGKLSVASMIKNILISEYEKYSRNVSEKYGNENSLDGFMKFLWGRLRSVYIKGYNNVAIRDLDVEKDGIAFGYGLIDSIQSHTRRNKDGKEVTEYILLHEGREVKIREAAVYNAALQEFEDTFHLRLANCLERGLRVLWAGFRRKYRRSSATYIFELHFILLSHTGMLAESSYEIQMYDYINEFININGLKAKGVQFYKPFRFGYSVYQCMDCDRDFLEDGLIRIKDVDTEYVVEVFGMANENYLERKRAKEGVFSANSNFRLMKWDVLKDESIHVIDNLLREVKESALNAKEE